MATIDDQPITPAQSVEQGVMPRVTRLKGTLLLSLLVGAAYLPAIHGKFILDDDILLTDSYFIAAPNGLFWFWFTNKPIDFYPVSNTTLWIEWRLWDLNPTGYHVTNLLLHIASALLVWAILRKLLVPGAFLAALLFAVHPVNVEAVAWIAQRKDLLATVFFLLTILWYLKADESFYHGGQIPSSKTPSPPTVDKWYRLSLLAYMLAMLSKGTPAILPVMLLGLAWWQRGRITRLDFWRTTPFFLVAVALTAINIWCQNRILDEPLRSGFVERLSGAGAVVWFYLSKAILPINLIFIYPLWHIQTGNSLWWLPLVAAVAVTALLVSRAFAQPSVWSRTLLFAWGFYCVALLPVMGFADVGFMKFSLVADHYQHIAVIGVMGLVAAMWSVWRDRAPGAVRPLSMAAAIALVVALTFLTWQQTHLYADPVTLYQTTLEKNPDSWMIRNNLGSELNEVGQPLEAIEQCEEVLRRKPDVAEAFYNIGTARKQLGQLEQAVENYQRAVALKPDYPDAFNNLGIVLGRLGRFPEAIAQFEKALALDAKYADAHSNLGLALFKLDRTKEAIEHFETALRLQPAFAEAHAGLAAALAREGRLQEALEHYQQAVQIKPRFSEAWARLAEVYAQLQQPAEATAAAQQGLELARSQGQTALENQISAWLKDYLAQPAKAREDGSDSRQSPR